jgi:TatD DNase family protein
MLIDTHCHLDAAEFSADRASVVDRALASGVGSMVVPAVDRASFSAVATLCREYSECFPAYGIHPLYVDKADLVDLADLTPDFLDQAVAIGEIGLDYFIPERNEARQLEFFTTQLRLARERELPVILHVRKAVDAILRELRKTRVKGGIAHAFNGSLQQAGILIEMGFALGFGGAMTYDNAHHIRRLATTIPLENIVLETDAPDIPPAWKWRQRNEPGELGLIAAVLAELRQIPVEEVIAVTGNNALRVLPGLKKTLA